MTALAFCRFAHFMAAMLTCGMSAYLWAYAPERLTLALSPIVRRLALIASLVALITAIAWLALESASMADDWTAALDPSLIGAVLTDTAFGPAWAAHLVLAATVAVVVFGPRARWAATAIASAALLASLGLVGHAAMQTGGEGVLHRANHALHLLTTGAWVGGLVPFAMCLRAYRRGDLRRNSVQAMTGFSFWGQFIVVAIILTGVANIALTSGHPPIPPTTPYRAGGGSPAAHRHQRRAVAQHRPLRLLPRRARQQSGKPLARGPVGRLHQVPARGFRDRRKAERHQRADAQHRAADDA